MGEQPPRSSPAPTTIKLTIARTRLLMSCSPSCPTLLPDQLPDGIEIFILIAGLVAAMKDANIALAVDEHGAGHAGHGVRRTDLAVLVIDDRKGHGRCLQPFVRRLRIGFHIDTDQREAAL